MPKLAVNSDCRIRFKVCNQISLILSSCHLERLWRSAFHVFLAQLQCLVDLVSSLILIVCRDGFFNHGRDILHPNGASFRTKYFSRYTRIKNKKRPPTDLNIVNNGTYITSICIFCCWNSFKNHCIVPGKKKKTASSAPWRDLDKIKKLWKDVCYSHT